MKLDYMYFITGMIFLLSVVNIVSYILNQYNAPLLVYCSSGFVIGVLCSMLFTTYKTILER